MVKQSDNSDWSICQWVIMPWPAHRHRSAAKMSVASETEYDSKSRPTGNKNVGSAIVLQLSSLPVLS